MKDESWEEIHPPLQTQIWPLYELQFSFYVETGFCTFLCVCMPIAPTSTVVD
jgi:hypothetical protein